MTTPREPEITDELLSAYIDDAVTPDERRHIEQAAAEDAEVAWRLQSLQMTVHLLHELPALALPRSFVLTPEQAGESIVGAAVTPQAAPPQQPVAPRRTVQPKQPGFWTRLGDGWRTFWQSGSPALRNAMATSLVLFFVLLAAPRFIAAPLGEVAVAPAAESAREVAAAEESAAPAAVTTDNLAATANEAAADSAPAPAADMDLARKALPEAAAAPAATAAPTNAPEGAAVTIAAVEEAAAAPAAESAAVAAEAAPPAAAPMALSAAAGPDQSPAQEADPLAAARALAPPAEAGGGPADAAAPALAAPAAAPVVASAPTATSTVAPTATPNAAPTVTPTIPPTAPATATALPTAASLAQAQGAPAASAPSRVEMPAASGSNWLPLAQLATAAGFLLFGLLWWRSRR